MSSRSKPEAFPDLPQQAFAAVPSSNNTNGSTRRPRKSSNLGADPRGDTGGNSIATSLQSQQSVPTKYTRGGGKRKKAKSLFNRWKRMSLKHTWVNPLVLVLIILGAYFVSPGEHNPLHHAIFLSYANPPLHERTNPLPAEIGNVTQYGKGKLDFAFVAFYTVVLSFTREFLMQRMIRPIALWYGIRARGKQSRFMEQFYTAIYFGIFGPFGLYVMSRTPVWYFNTAGMYEGFPHRSHEAVFKAYYLLQASYWAQQGIVLMLQLEKPRKDFKELVLHHIITLSLIGLSYRFHFTYMGIAVYITHDISDFFLATSKILNYIDSSITAPYFTMFMVIWAYLRHYLNLRILKSLLPGGEFKTIGPYELNWDTQQYKCWISQVITFPLLAALQAVNIFWFILILRILWRVLSTGEEKDERSDNEEEEDEIDEGKSYADAVKENGETTKPQVMLNGKPMSSAGVETRAAAKRRS
ncbi:Sphingosine N-acyltransferase-like protein FUM17 [Fulvia fulva]|uniref:Sphingosine N-acyltransferase-like protein FUM17 n=1 Tax=Passalora fulva TaxID=5499 RepID=A0A9Q8LBG3_PASFU|nr:Sphingosine N-acyltransferase-like protein FUM17 [Fulvia fulva]KAK4632187.1 Sphingosine N-acyltransferase-like protein FUM17 [Fulvia fulva]KAK4632986.1 Sphingosine N-acyltransferase-like protein FUM17 [Fulvia fulva]UJO14362.1 Sphingosine N-acyltransferase-like protein FUM17 [Fulvia fulva]WPV10522.1 Sphingosine N-acyltransferase-like protein FUM17 [Fulvia fulva]WPV26039.1 Sphingosine N-acyltransferase-like protein FUM17 [Fulvia fulva]